MKKKYFLLLIFIFFTLCITSVYSQNPTVTLTDNITGNLIKNSDVVSITATFNESIGTTTPTITIKENDEPINIYISDSSGRISLLVQHGGLAPITRNTAGLVSYTFKSVSSGVTYTLNSLNYTGQSWVSFNTSPEYNEGTGNKDVIFIGKTIIDNVPMTEVSGSSPSRSTWDYSWTASITLNTVSATVSGIDVDGNAYSGTDSLTFNIDKVAPILERLKPDEDTTSFNDGIVTDSNTVTFTATFSESMGASPTISITGVSPLSYSHLSSMTLVSTDNDGDTNWSYGWDVPSSSSVTTGTVSISVSGSDIAGNEYTGLWEDVILVRELRLFIDNTPAPTVLLTDSDTDNLVSGSDVVTITATFNKSMANSPTINITGEVSNQSISTVTPTTRIVADIGMSDYGYDMLALGSYNWAGILGADSSSGGLISHTLEINGVDYFIHTVGYNDASSDIANTEYWWYVKTTPEYTPGYSLPSFDNDIVIKSPNFEQDSKIWQYSWTVSTTASGNVSATVAGTDFSGKAYAGTDSITFTLYQVPSVTFSDTDSDNLVSGSSVVTITAIFNNSMAATPTINIIGEVSNVAMTASSTAAVWIYPWTVSTTTSGIVTATVSGTDTSGISYAGSTSITFTIDNTAPTVTLTDTDSNNIVAGSNVVTITATFSEAMAVTPTINITGEVSNVAMTASSTASVWIYPWTVSTTTSGIVSATIAGTDLSGKAYAGSDSITFTIDNVPPKAGTYEIAAYEYFEYDELVKLESLNGGSGWSGAWIDYGATNEKQGHYILSQTSRGNTDSSQSDGIYALNQRSSMTYPGLTISGNYLGGINWQTDVPTKSYRELYRKFGEDIYVQFLVQFNDFGNADDTKVKNNYFILQEDDTERLVIRRKNGRIYMAKTTSSSASNDIVDTGVALKGSTDAQLVIVNIGASKTKIWVDPDLSSFDYSNPPAENAYLNYSFEFNRINIESQNKYINGVPSLYDEITIFERSGSLSDTDSDNIVSNSDVVTITATFSESMAATPTLSLSGIITNTEMTATSSASIWTYAWTVSTTVTSTTATVSGTDLSGNAYAGTDSITFTIDNILPTVTLTDTDSDNLVSNSDVVTITATFSESMTATPTLSLSGITSNVLMTATASTSVWTYAWTVSTSINSIIATVSGTDLVGNAYAGTDSITFTIDNILPTVILTDTDSDNLVSNSDVVTITATFSESMSATPTLNLSGITSNALMSATDSASVWTYAWTVSTTVTLSTATVYGTDLSGNAYAGTDSITFTIDNSVPTVTLTDTDSDNLVSNSDVVTITATFSESMSATPTLNLSGITSNALMSATDSASVWAYTWTVSTTVTSTTANVSGTDLLGNLYSGNESIVFIVDDSAYIVLDSNGITVKATSAAVIGNTYALNGTFYTVVDDTNIASQIDGGNYNLCTTRVTDFSNLFMGNNDPNPSTFNSDISFWDTSNGTTMKNLFNLAVDFDQDLSAWDTSNVIDMSYMFKKAYKYNNGSQNGIGDWDTSKVTTMNRMFERAYKFNQDIGDWDTSSVLNMEWMFHNAIVFNQDISEWCVSSISEEPNNFLDPAPAFVNSSYEPNWGICPDKISTIVILTNTDADKIVSNSDVLTITATFSESMSATPTLSLSGIISNALMSATDSASVWTYAWTVSTTVTLSTATVSGTDLAGNAYAGTESLVFQIKPLNSGGASPIKSTISITPQEMIANSLNSATITVQAKDSVGQNFLTGGAKIRIFALSTEYTVLDNNNGTYSASFIPDAIQTDTKDVNFTFSVEGITATNEFNLLLHRDQDGDGVYDINDTCPRTDSGFEVDAKGCALNQLDSDNDGVFDDVDECPDTPEQELNNVQGTPTYGELIPTVVDEKGCGASQRDTDGDGIVDTEDNCIETANADQADTDGDGIGDVCDTDNPLPQITSTEIKFVQLPQNGTTVGKIEATDPDGEVLTFTQAGDNFKGVLSIASDGSITVSSGALLIFDSAYNGASLGFTLSDGVNEVTGSVKIVIEDAPRPPEISIITLEVSEDAQEGTIVGFVEAKDPMGGQIVSILLQGDGFIELVDGVLKTTQELDYETTTAHPFTITAQASDRSDGPGLTGSKSESLRVSDIPNATYTGRFFISIFNVSDETLGAKVDHRRYFNPYNKNVGKWKVKKRVAGGADADKFTIKTKSKTDQKNGDPIEDENEDYLDFITPPDYENPGDANGDNIYEVEVEYVNTDDGAPEVPVVVTQTNIQVPEGSTTTIELQSQPVLPTDDNDGDGVPDIIDNSPLVANADQTDEDGDGVGDVSDDFDHDGVWNPFDTCPDTPLGEIVDSNGCLIYYIPSSNFSISKTEKCAGTNSINIEVVDTSITYNVSVSGAATLSDSFSSSSWSLDNLSAGVYSICITVEGVSSAEFERCFEVTISEPDPLIVNSMFNKNDQTITFGLNGGVSYDITHNGITTQTTKNSYTVSLAKGLNRISISTGIECQGLFENTYLNSYEVKYAPNPFSSELTFTIGGEDRVFALEVYTPSGQLIDQKVITLPFGIRYYTLQTDNYKQGGYFIRVKGSTIDQSFQVIKE
ncbi:BspA family leucine-rich repeat surface protein [Flavobacteriaceae bacterium]|nr:BspA family leucine-rich repeat surface protein [Flavobacteriaceae bacterium]MDA9833697.1 BspA family leucine-rich repeat surface protein [Flavobacteriaceae bacterium]